MNIYKKHKKREIECIDGLWDFSLDDKFDNNQRVAVPGCWDTTLEFAGYRGKAWYRTDIVIKESGFYRFTFDGVANSAKITINGKLICTHYGPHTKFYTDIIELMSGGHRMVVEVDNSFGSHNTLMEQKCGWRCFGGIHRSVFMEKMVGTYIETVHVSTVAINQNSAELKISTTLHNFSTKSISETLSINISNECILDIDLKIPPESRKQYSRDIIIESARLWSPEAPDLYTLVADIAGDDYITRFGIRTIKCSNGNILLNGKKIFIKGINHHDYQPLTGYTQTLAQIKYDLDIIKNMGCNLIRTSHYPKDDLFLDLCDEMGLMVWEEATGWQNTPEVITMPLFEKQCSQCIDEMVKEHFNHSSIIIWGLLNEVRSEFEEVRPVISSLISRFRELDSLRPVTFATNRLLHNKDKMLDLVDIISPNLYTGWYKDFYGEEAEELDEAGYFNKLLEWFDEEGLSEKPVLVGEFGAGGIAGFHSFAKERWSEEFQDEILTNAIESYINHPHCAGAIVWLFADTLCSESEALYRPYSHNSKGVVDAYRRPKAGYKTVKKYFKDGGLAHIRHPFMLTF